jgi:hypothetical protein
MTARDARELLATEYLRPFAARSDYLDTAVTPSTLAGPRRTLEIARRTPDARRRTRAQASSRSHRHCDPPSRIRQLGLNNSAARRSHLGGGSQVSRVRLAI